MLAETSASSCSDRGVRPAHVEHRLGGEAAAEEREPAEQPLFCEIEQPDAPVDRRAHRPVAHRRIPRAARERVETGVEQPQQLSGRERPKPRRGQLDRQRQPLEPVADLVKLGAVGIDPCARGRRSGGEQPAGGVPVQRVDVEDPFGAQPKQTPARHEHGQARSSIEQRGDLRCAVDEVLEVVEDEQELAVSKLLVQQLVPARRAGLPQPDGPGDRRQQELSLGDRGEVDERRPVGEPGAELVAELDGEPRLADAAGAEQRHEPGCRIEQAAGELRQRSLTADRRRLGARHPEDAGLGLRVGVECGIVREDPAFQLAQLGRRLEPQLVDQQHPSFAVTGKRVGLPSGPVEGGHQVPAQALAQRVLPDELLELGQHLVVPAEPEICVDPALDAREPQVVETRRLVPRERARREVGQRIAPPQVGGAGEEDAREPGVVLAERLPPVGQQQLEAGRVELALLELEPIARRARDEAAGWQRTPNLRDVQAQNACRRRRRGAVPDRLRQGLDGGRPARPQDERGQRRTRTLRAQLDRRAVHDHLELTEHPDFHLRAMESRCPRRGAPLHRPVARAQPSLQPRPFTRAPARGRRPPPGCSWRDR